MVVVERITRDHVLDLRPRSGHGVQLTVAVEPRASGNHGERNDHDDDSRHDEDEAFEIGQQRLGAERVDAGARASSRAREWRADADFRMRTGERPHSKNDEGNAQPSDGLPKRHRYLPLAIFVLRHVMPTREVRSGPFLFRNQ